MVNTRKLHKKEQCLLDATIDKLTVLADIEIHKDAFIEKVQSLGFEMQAYKSTNYGYSQVFLHEYAGRIELAEGRKRVDAQDLVQKKNRLLSDIKQAKKGQAHENALSIEEMESILDNINEQLDQCDERGYLDRLKDVRYEFNPKYYDHIKGVREASKGVISMLEMKSHKVSNIHIALDYYVKISDLSIIDTKTRKRTTIEGKNGKLETKYLGSRSGRNNICIYDKKQENEDKGTLDQYEGLNKVTRFEARLKNNYAKDFKTSDFNPFDGILVHYLETLGEIENNTSMKIEDRAMILYLLRNPSSLAEMEKSKKSRWTKKLKELSCIDIEPNKDFEQKKYSLVGTLESITNKHLFQI
ncbi:replication initiation factor domain-containing protein [Priestia megaterium]|uniref:replication initiation factor domain-containing protein n=1 Tax=Priestia megaterium TaxID=1404 RepID=UPI002FFE6339